MIPSRIQMTSPGTKRQVGARSRRQRSSVIRTWTRLESIQSTTCEVRSDSSKISSGVSRYSQLVDSFFALQLRSCSNQSNRCTQLVGSICGELLDSSHPGFQPRKHLIECFSETLELVAGFRHVQPTRLDDEPIGRDGSIRKIPELSLFRDRLHNSAKARAAQQYALAEHRKT